MPTKTLAFLPQFGNVAQYRDECKKVGVFADLRSGGEGKFPPCVT